MERRLTNLRFANDIVLFSSSAQQLEEMLQLGRASFQVGLKINMSKTQIMKNATKHRIQLQGQAMHYVGKYYIYLGQVVPFTNIEDKEIERRIDTAWKSYWSMEEQMKGGFPLSLKCKLVDICVLTVPTYDAQTWYLTESQMSRLKVYQRTMEHSMLGVKSNDHIRNLHSKTRISHE